jgi:excisionase family DNA binding protein
MTKLSVRLEEAQEMMGISHFTLRRLVKNKKLKAARVGRRLLIRSARSSAWSSPARSCSPHRTKRTGPE